MIECRTSGAGYGKRKNIKREMEAAVLAHDFAKAFYRSKQWQKCRNGFFKSKGGLCEACLAKGLAVPGEIVHHIVELTPENINDPNVTLSWDNLRLVCRECHALEHGAKMGRRYLIDENGNVISKGVFTERGAPPL
jgi:hypothetical protein